MNTVLAQELKRFNGLLKASRVFHSQPVEFLLWPDDVATMHGRTKGKVKLGLLLKYLKMWVVYFVYDYLGMDGRTRYPNVWPMLPCLRVPRVMQAIQGSLKDIQKAGQGEFIWDRNFQPKKWLHPLPREVVFWLTNLSCFTHQPSPHQEKT